MAKMNFHIGGKCKVTVRGSIPETFLNACAMWGIPISGLESIDGHTISFTVDEADYPELEKCAKECMCFCEQTGEAEGRKKLRFIKKHLWLPASAAILLPALLLSSLFIWDIDVMGNKRLSDAEIIRALKDCGVECGSFRLKIDRDKVKTLMMEKLPDIAWMSINVNGSRATVPILEREDVPEIMGSREY